MTYSFVISRSTVQFRPLAPYKTMGYRITSVAHFACVGTRLQTGAALYRFVSPIRLGCRPHQYLRKRSQNINAIYNNTTFLLA